MKKLGLLVAVEIDAVLQTMGTIVKKERCFGFPVYTYQFAGGELYVIHTGAGEVAAAAAAQLLICRYGVETVVNFGVVGGLTPDMALCQCCVVESVVHYDFDTSALDHCEVGRYVEDYPTVYLPATAALVEKAVQAAPELQRIICASGDKFLADPEKKAELNRRYGAKICEMEAAGVVLTCNRSGVDCLLIKAVSDSVSGGAGEYEKMMLQASKTCLQVAARIMEEL